VSDLVITPANVLPDPGTSGADSPFTGICGAGALTQCQPVYFDTATETYIAASASNPNLAKATAITLNAADPGQPISLLSGGGITPGATLVLGTQYVLSHNTGKIAPRADLTTGDTITYLFIADSTTHAFVNITQWGITL
jgi:hypothetical protein